jgi:hypothetical protein
MCSDLLSMMMQAGGLGKELIRIVCPVRIQAGLPMRQGAVMLVMAEKSP